MPSVRLPRFEGSIHLAGGRSLGFAEFGPSDGRPLLWFHGTPGARRQIAPQAHEEAHARGIRIITVERPGIGSSSAHGYDAIRDFADDIEELVDALDVSTFAVAGLSGGGPYALACAHEMPERVVTAALLGGVAPFEGEDRVGGGPSQLARWLSPVFALASKPLGIATSGLVQALEPLAEQAIDLFARFMPPGDRLVFDDAEIRQMFSDDLSRGGREQMEAIFLDVVLFGRHWGFELGGVEVPVHLWYGDADNIVPVAHGEHMADRLPNATLRIRADEGHLGGLGASAEIFDAVLETWEDRQLEAHQRSDVERRTVSHGAAEPT